MHKYRVVSRKGEGTFSEVLKAQSIKSGKYVAIKCMKSHFSTLEQVNSLREVQALRRLSPHPNIIKLLEALYDAGTGRLALVFELMEMNLYELIRGRTQYLPEDRIRKYMYQLLKAIDHMHRNGVFHRDIKPENILITDEALKVADFGSCRGIYSKMPYTEYISTRWYRAPESLLTDGYYNHKMDTWGVGCVFFEIASLFPLFPGTNELDQLDKIHTILGTPSPELLARIKAKAPHVTMDFPHRDGVGIAKLVPHLSADAQDLIMQLLTYDPEERPSARQALRHPYFKELREEEKCLKLMLVQELGIAADTAQRSYAPAAPLSARLRNLPADIRGPRLNEMLASSGEADSGISPDAAEARPGALLAELAQAGVSLANEHVAARILHAASVGIRDTMACTRSMEAEAQSSAKLTGVQYSVLAHGGQQQALQTSALRSMAVTGASQQLPYSYAAPKPSVGVPGVPWDGCPPGFTSSSTVSGTVASAGAALLAKVRQTIGVGAKGMTTARRPAVQRGTYRSGVNAGTRKYVSPYSQRVLAQARTGITTGPE